VSLAIAGMQLTNSVHPPGGAFGNLSLDPTCSFKLLAIPLLHCPDCPSLLICIALVSVVGGEKIQQMEWKLLLSAIFVSSIMLAWTLLLVNVRKQYPKHWVNYQLW
jgi:CBS-domain-containing membrane protein